MKLRAFNLIPGVVYWTDTRSGGASFVATSVIWDKANESVKVFARDIHTDHVETHIFDYSETVDLLGISIHPEDPDETDFGTEDH